MKHLSLVLPIVLVACDIPVDPAHAADDCEARARAAQGPQGTLTLGANNNTGPFASASVGISSDFLRGSDPVALYESCVFQKTGALPIRPPVLRDIR